jgi:SAM-dependent methyltransferase
MLRILRVWPVPAVLTWGLAWVIFRMALEQGASGELAAGLGAALGVGSSLLGDSWWRRVWIAGGFPASLMLTWPSLGLASMPAWGWLIPLAALLLVYPLNAWRDAPVFPTHSLALRDLPLHAPLAVGARVLDAGCGLGHGLRELHLAYPQAQLVGMEWSTLLRWVCALRCPWAQVRRADIWKEDWSGFDLVYLFQRPETMPRAWAKAAKELRPGAWLVSLEFEVKHLAYSARYETPSGKMVWLYRAPLGVPQGD